MAFAWVLGAAVVGVLGTQGGGYDAVVRADFGIAVWWLFVLGVLVGILPIARPGRTAAACFALLGLLLLWTAASLAWTQSTERTFDEVVRVAVLLGPLALAGFGVTAGARGHLLHGMAVAVVLVAGVAVLSRLQPELFGRNETAAFLPAVAGRLSYPVNYWNGLAALAALGLPLVIYAAVSARHLAARAAAVAGVPVLVLCVYLTYSRGGALAALAALVALVALTGSRLVVAAGALGGAAGALVVAAAASRSEVAQGMTTALAREQGDALLAILVATCAAAALLTVAASRLPRPAPLARRLPGPRVVRAALLAATATAVLAMVVTGAAGALWDSFKTPPTSSPALDPSRFTQSTGSGRYQFWEVAVNAAAGSPLNGIGAGTFEFVWARDAPITFFARDAHSIWVESFAELGAVGLALVAALLLLPLVDGARRAWREPGDRIGAGAAATAAIVAFVVTATLDWAWELTVLPAAFMLLVVAATGTARPQLALARSVRAVVVSIAVLVIALIALPRLATQAVRDSQRDSAGGQLDASLNNADRAARLLPFAATPAVQQALVLQQRGEARRALPLAREATAADPINWRTWYVRWSVARDAGRAPEAAAAYARARALNPRSPLFAR